VADDGAATKAFEACRARFEEVIAWASGPDAAGMSHGDLEVRLAAEARETFRQVFQDTLDLRATREVRLGGVVDAAGVAHRYAEEGHGRGLESVFGTVIVTRIAYRRRGEKNLCPADGALNLPAELQGRGLRRLAAIESTRDSFEGAAEAIERSTGVVVGKRQVEQLAQKTAVDFDAFYDTRRRSDSKPGDVVVLSADGKGIVMRPDSLRKDTAKAAVQAQRKLEGRLSGGEKCNRKRMAEIGAVYEVAPVPRTASDIMARRHDGAERAPAPEATNKWCVASVADDTVTVIVAVFDEAERRDPDHNRTWVALVDGTTTRSTPSPPKPRPATSTSPS
jgi:bifunctional DNA-binding transcriptional regulator/antitoxin component of YhaV-PrlF toxin-antitoxin module